MTLTVGSLFSGVGGLDLGLEQAGLKTVWQVEFDDWCREKLAENFPHTEKFKDVREVGKHNLRKVDIVCGGFPCQDISASKRDAEGIDGERSGLWAEYFRILRELRPKYALIENVSKLTVFGLSRVLSDLASIGYDAEWQTLRATDVELFHERKRLFIIAYSQSKRSVLPEIFAQNGNQSLHNNQRKLQPRRPASIHLESIGRSFPQIPEHLRVDNGISFELSEIERAVKGYGNAVCPPIGKWLGERIIEFDAKIERGLSMTPNN